MRGCCCHVVEGWEPRRRRWRLERGGAAAVVSDPIVAL